MSHHSLFEEEEENDVEEGAAKEHEDDDEDEAILTMPCALFWLAVITVLVAMLSEYLTGAIEGAAEGFNMSEGLIGFVILPIVGNAAEHGKSFKCAGAGASAGACVCVLLFAWNHHPPPLPTPPPPSLPPISHGACNELQGKDGSRSQRGPWLEYANRPVRDSSHGRLRLVHLPAHEPDVRR